MNSLSRPTNIEELLERLSRFQSEQALAGLANLRVRPSDVFIATYAKSGTTWMQQVVHQLRTNGDTDFDEITAVVPWVDMAVDMGVDPETDQAGGFRAFKTHQMYSTAGAGAGWGALWGLLFGLIFFVPVLGAAVGASRAADGVMSTSGFSPGFPGGSSFTTTLRQRQ